MELLIKKLSIILIQLLILGFGFTLLTDFQIQIKAKVIGVLFLWYFVFYIFPLLLLFFNYYKYYKNTIITKDEKSSTISVTIRSKEVKFLENEVLEAVNYVTPPKYENRFDILNISDFYFTRIELNNGARIIITSLSKIDIKLLIPNIEIKRKKMFLPLILSQTNS